MTNDKKPQSARSRPKARVLLVDDHPVVREGFTRVIEQQADLEVVGTATDATQALDVVRDAKPDVAVVDIALAESHGLELVKDLRERYPAVAVLMVSMHDEALYAERALRAGAKGYLMKSEPPQKLVQAIRKVASGGLFFSEAVTAAMLEGVSRFRTRTTRSPMELLSDREIEVLEMIGRGQTTRQVAECLHLSTKTVQAHREHIKQKLQLENATALVRYAVHWIESEKRP